MAKPKKSRNQDVLTASPTEQEYIGGWVPSELKEKLRQEARTQHRTITHQFTFILESYYNNLKGNNNAT